MKQLREVQFALLQWDDLIVLELPKVRLLPWLPKEQVLFLALLSSLDRVDIMGRVKPESGSGSEVHSHRDSVHLEQSHLFQL